VGWGVVVCVCQTNDVGQVGGWGGSKKSVFARTSLMDDPIAFMQMNEIY